MESGPRETASRIDDPEGKSPLSPASWSAVCTGSTVKCYALLEPTGAGRGPLVVGSDDTIRRPRSGAVTKLFLCAFNRYGVEALRDEGRPGGDGSGPRRSDAARGAGAPPGRFGLVAPARRSWTLRRETGPSQRARA